MTTLLVELEYAPLKKTSIKTTPMMPLSSILAQACEKLGLPKADENAYRLRSSTIDCLPLNCVVKFSFCRYQKNYLDLSLSVRFANLPTGAKLFLVKSKSNDDSIPSVVNVALQLDDGNRVVDKFPAATKLWDILLQTERKSNGVLNLTRRTGVPTTDKLGNGDIFKAIAEFAKLKKAVYMVPVLLVMSTEFNSVEALKQSSLADAGLKSGSGVIRLLFRYSEKTLEQMLPLIESETTTQPFPSRTTSLILTDVSQKMEVVQNPVVKEQIILPEVENVATKEVETHIKESVPLSNEIKTTLSKMEIDKNEQNLEIIDVTQLSRDIHLYYPPPDDIEGPSQIELPDSFFELNSSELKMLVQSQKYKRDNAENKPLLTKALREKEEELKRKKWPKTLIRVRFPDRITLQATFYSHEPVSELYSVIRNAIDGSHAFQLYVTPPMRTISDDMSLNFWSAKLSPQSVVYIKWPENIERGSWTSEYISKLEDFPVPKFDIQPDAVLSGTEKAAAVAAAVTKTTSNDFWTGSGFRLDAPSSSSSGLSLESQRMTSKESKSDKGGTPAWFKIGKF
ncbi:Tether containing UBX domain for GLUT4, partial [Nowakowskiella sp. JEL0078]